MFKNCCKSCTPVCTTGSGSTCKTSSCFGSSGCLNNCCGWNVVFPGHRPGFIPFTSLLFPCTFWTSKGFPLTNRDGYPDQGSSWIFELIRFLINKSLTLPYSSVSWKGLQWHQWNFHKITNGTKISNGKVQSQFFTMQEGAFREIIRKLVKRKKKFTYTILKLWSLLHWDAVGLPTSTDLRRD